MTLSHTKVKWKGVSGPIIPTPLDHLGPQPFSFYPAILNIEHNEWVFRRATGSDIQVTNTKTHAELWVPRRFVGEVSLVGEPVMIVGLVKELEYREGAVYPHVRRVIEMPLAVNDSARRVAREPQNSGPRPHRLAEVVGIRIESPRESRAGRIMFGTIAAGLLACLTAVIVFRDATPGARATTLRSSQAALPFAASDDFDSIVAKFGAPAKDQWRDAGEVHYRRLWYPASAERLRRGIAVILIDGRFAGAIDANGHVIQSVEPFTLKNLR
jgi:hypothetical protein